MVVCVVIADMGAGDKLQGLFETPEQAVKFIDEQHPDWDVAEPDILRGDTWMTARVGAGGSIRAELWVLQDKQNPCATLSTN